MRIQFSHSYEEIISVENLLAAWKEFVRGKRGKPDVQLFSRHLMANILQLHDELASFSYRHGRYYSFHITDPKPRHIHKADVRDRLLHHAIYRKLYPFFDRTFIADSFSCRNNKGTHAANDRFRSMAYKASRNNTRTCWVLQCDIRKFFASIDHGILIGILRQYIPDEDIMRLLEGVISSFYLSSLRVGLPLGNLTSQLFVNVYMNEFDQFAKHQLKAKSYIRYADDFVVMSDDREWLVHQIPQIRLFLDRQLSLSLHSKKVHIHSLASGIDFLGWVHFSDHKVLRTRTKQRMFRRFFQCPLPAVLQSYIGLLQHGNTDMLASHIRNLDWFIGEDEY
ncbi:MAG: reverse transcriptase/maturase family protein [Candidatus Kerfeldbacteria bacterium]